jgi:hypothetical protein
MDKFYESNPDYLHVSIIDFPDYSTDELLQIAKIMLQDQYQLTAQAEVALTHIQKKRKTIIR